MKEIHIKTHWKYLPWRIKQETKRLHIHQGTSGMLPQTAIHHFTLLTTFTPYHTWNKKCIWLIVIFARYICFYVPPPTLQCWQPGLLPQPPLPPLILLLFNPKNFQDHSQKDTALTLSTEVNDKVLIGKEHSFKSSAPAIEVRHFKYGSEQLHILGCNPDNFKGHE